MANPTSKQGRTVDIGQFVQQLLDAQAAYEKALEARSRARDLVRMFESNLTAEERKQVGELIKKSDRGKGTKAVKAA